MDELFECSLLHFEKPFELSHNERKAVTWSGCMGLAEQVFDLAYPTRLSIPNKAKKARFSCSFAFPANVSGYRQVFSRLNGDEHPTGYITSSHYGGFENGSSNSFCAIGPWINVSKNDYWELIVKQDSGRSMTVEPKTCCWFQAEWRS